MRPVATRLVAILAIAAVAVVAIAGSASAALTAVPTRTFSVPEFFDVANDGTIWWVTGSGGGTFGHTDDEGNDLGDGFNWSYPNFDPHGVGYYGNRLYMTGSVNFGHRLISFQANSSDPGHDFLPSDSATDDRIGVNQSMFRMFEDGGMAVALGQENKIGILDGKGLFSDHPYYPQSFHGAGINYYYDPAKVPYGMESCHVSLDGPPVAGEPTACGTHAGYYGANGPSGFDYPNDVAPGLGGFYVSEGGAGKIKHINTVANPGATVDFEFGGPGSGAGQLSGPESIVRQPGTGNLYISEGGNRRISVFDAGGGYIASFGYGVRTGADQMEVCGIEIGPCQAGVSYLSDPRSYFSRLDFSPDGSELFAYMALPNQIQVFQVGGGSSPGTGSGGGTEGGGAGSGSGTPTPLPPPGKDKVRIKAKPLKVAKGKKTKLTAIVNPPATCTQRLVLFQKKVARSWDNLGRAVKPGKGCTASKSVKVTAKSVFRAVLIRSSNQATLAYSPNLTVKLK